MIARSNRGVVSCNQGVKAIYDAPEHASPIVAGASSMFSVGDTLVYRLPAAATMALVLRDANTYPVKVRYLAVAHAEGCELGQPEIAIL